MSAYRLLSAAAVAVGVTVSAWGQAPADPPKDAPKDPPAASTPSGTPTAPKANPEVQKAFEELAKGQPDSLEKAVAILKAAKEKDKLLEPPLVILAGGLYTNGTQTNNAQTVQAARQLLERAGAEDPTHPDPYILSGGMALGEGRLMDAVLCFETALVKASDARFLHEERQRFFKSARGGLAQAYGNRGEGQKALDQLKALLAEDQKNAGIRWQVARLTFFNNPEAAFEELKKAFADDPNNPQIGLPEVNMGRFWDGKGSTQKDESARKKEEADNKAKAEEWFNKALAAYAKDVRAPREFARWLLNQGRLEDADKQLVAAKGLKADDNETNALMGLSHRYKKQFGEAEKIFDSLNRLDRTNQFYAWNLALSMAESADEKVRQQGVALAQVEQTRRPRDPEAMSVLAWCLYKVDRLDDAEKALVSALQAGNNNAPPDTVYYLARILDKKGKPTEARDRLKQAVEVKTPFVYRSDAEALYKALCDKHGLPKDDKKDEKKPEEKKP